jgi:hypothetical protein
MFCGRNIYIRGKGTNKKYDRKNKSNEPDYEECNLLMPFTRFSLSSPIVFLLRHEVVHGMLVGMHKNYQYPAH